MPHTRKARTNTFYIHTHTNVHTYVFYSCSLPHTLRHTHTHAGKQADKATHADSYTPVHTHAHSITGMYYKYTLQYRLLHLAKWQHLRNAPLPSTSALSVHSQLWLWHALQQHNLFSCICYMRVGSLSVCPYWLVITNNPLVLPGWITSDYLSTQAKCCSKNSTV